MRGTYRVTTSMRPAKPLLACLAGLVLASCGGGGVESTTQPPGGSVAERLEIVYAHAPASDGFESELYLMSADGRTVRSLLRMPGQEFSPEWAPDGNSVIFAHREMTPPNYPLSIWTVSADGSGLAKIDVEGSAGDEIRWTRDGGRLAFTTPLDSVGNVSGISVVNADGSGSRMITSGTDGHKNVHPAWSPDGQWILYARYPGAGEPANGGCSLFKAPVSGGAILPLTPPLSSGPCFGASWR